MQSPADQKKTCPRCRKAVPRIYPTCEFCGYDLTSQIPPSVTDREYLAKDTWTQPTDREATQTTSFDTSASRRPTAQGYEGRRPDENRFKHTVAISTGRDPNERHSEHPKPIAASARRSSSPPSSGITESPNNPTETPGHPAISEDSAPPAPRDSSSHVAPITSTGSLRLGMGNKKNVPPPVPNSLTSLAISSVVLMAAWLLPDVWSDALIFPISKLDTFQGLDLFTTLLRPIAGALCLGLVALPIKTKLRCTAAAPLLMAALGLPIMINPTAASAESGIAVALSAFSIPTALVAFITLKTKWAGHVTLMLIPASMLILVFHGVVSGDIPPSLVAAYKAPLELWALTLGITACVGTLSASSGQTGTAR